MCLYPLSRTCRPEVPVPMLVEKQRLFTVDEYHVMEEAGILTPEDRVACYRGPGPDGYAHRTVRRRGETLDVEALPAAGSFAVDEVLQS